MNALYRLDNGQPAGVAFEYELANCCGAVMHHRYSFHVDTNTQQSTQTSEKPNLGNSRWLPVSPSRSTADQGASCRKQTLFCPPDPYRTSSEIGSGHGAYRSGGVTDPPKRRSQTLLQNGVSPGYQKIPHWKVAPPLCAT